MPRSCEFFVKKIKYLKFNDDSCKLNIVRLLICRHRLTVRTPDFQSGNRSSILRGGTL